MSRCWFTSCCMSVMLCFYHDECLPCYVSSMQPLAGHLWNVMLACFCYHTCACNKGNVAHLSSCSLRKCDSKDKQMRVQFCHLSKYDLAGKCTHGLLLCHWNADRAIVFVNKVMSKGTREALSCSVASAFQLALVALVIQAAYQHA